MKSSLYPYMCMCVFFSINFQKSTRIVQFGKGNFFIKRCWDNCIMSGGKKKNLDPYLMAIHKKQFQMNHDSESKVKI